MKAKELAEMLLEYPDFEVKGKFCDASKMTYSHPWPVWERFDIDGIEEVDSINKIIVLDTIS